METNEKSTMPLIPVGHQAVMPYLIVSDADAFLNFLKEVFNAEEILIARHDNGEIMHGEVKIFDATVMLAQSSTNWQPMTAGMFIYVSDADETFNKAISLGAKVVLPLENKPYGRTGGVKDQYGNVWWITAL